MPMIHKLFVACLCAALPPFSAQALVGGAAEDSSFASATLMVLHRGARGAGFCTGVVIAPDVVLTAAHCVGGAADTRVHFRDGDARPLLERPRA